MAGHKDCRTHAQGSRKTRAQTSVLLLFSWQRPKVTSAGTHAALSRFTDTHIFTGSPEYQHGPSVHPAPLSWCQPLLPTHRSPAHQLDQLSAHGKHAALTHSSHGHP